MVILENIDIDIDKAILQNIDIDKISNRFKFGISNRATQPPQPNPQATLPQASTNYVLRVCEGKSTKDGNGDSIIIMMGHI